MYATRLSSKHNFYSVYRHDAGFFIPLHETMRYQNFEQNMLEYILGTTTCIRCPHVSGLTCYIILLFCRQIVYLKLKPLLHYMYYL